MKKTVPIFAMCLCAILWALQASSVITPALALDELVRDSSLVVVGEVISLESEAGQTKEIDENAIPTLSALLRTPEPEIRRAAGSALRQTHSQKAIGDLTFLLGDSDLETRYYAVVGLAEIAGQPEWRPNMDDFLADQKKYLNHWREWSERR